MARPNYSLTTDQIASEDVQDEDLFQDIVASSNPNADALPFTAGSLYSMNFELTPRLAFMNAKRTLDLVPAEDRSV